MRSRIRSFLSVVVLLRSTAACSAKNDPPPCVAYVVPTTADLTTPTTFIKDISPIYNAEKIKGGIFLYSGRDDIRVPIPQMYRMERALRSAGNAPAAFVVKEKEGHGMLMHTIDFVPVGHLPAARI